MARKKINFNEKIQVTIAYEKEREKSFLFWKENIEPIFDNLNKSKEISPVDKIQLYLIRKKFGNHRDLVVFFPAKYDEFGIVYTKNFNKKTEKVVSELIDKQFLKPVWNFNDQFLCKAEEIRHYLLIRPFEFSWKISLHK